MVRIAERRLSAFGSLHMEVRCAFSSIFVNAEQLTFPFTLAYGCNKSGYGSYCRHDRVCDNVLLATSSAVPGPGGVSSLLLDSATRFTCCLVDRMGFYRLPSRCSSVGGWHLRACPVILIWRTNGEDIIQPVSFKRHTFRLWVPDVRSVGRILTVS